MGAGVALYFASQGAGRVAGPVLAGSARFALVAVGGFLLVRFFGASLAGLYALIAVAMIVFGAGAAAAYVVVDGGTALLGARGSDSRGTGSTEMGSGTPQRMPVTQWVSDQVPLLKDHVVLVGGVALRPADLDRADEVTAELDCTGGWYAEQLWSGTRLDRLLGELAPEQCIEVRSVTGYRRRFPASDASRLWLATRAAGQPLSAGHGAPVRLVAPGRRGFWWVKWVDEVRVVDSPWWLQSPFPLQ